MGKWSKCERLVHGRRGRHCPSSVHVDLLLRSRCCRHSEEASPHPERRRERTRILQWIPRAEHAPELSRSESRLHVKQDYTHNGRDRSHHDLVDVVVLVLLGILRKQLFETRRKRVEGGFIHR
jgi:hypothetical protein